MRARRQGFVLVCVLWVLAVLTVIAVGFGRRAVLDARAATYTFDYNQARLMARAAVEAGMVELRNKSIIDKILDQSGRTSLDQRCFRRVNLLEEGPYFSKDAQTEGDECGFVIHDEDRYFDLNTVPEEILEEIDSLGFSLVRKILKRRGDIEDDMGLGEEMFADEEEPQPFILIEELRFIEGIDDEQWFGEGKKPGLRELFTCWGDRRININTAPPDVLRTLPGVGDEFVDALLDYRNGEDGKPYTEDDEGFDRVSDIWQKLDVNVDYRDSVYQYCKTDSRFFTITGFATRRQGKIRAYCAATVEMGRRRAGSGTDVEVVNYREGILGPQEQ